MSSPQEKHPLNHHIRAKSVYLIDKNGVYYENVTLENAIDMAKKSGMDLVQVSVNSEKPTCKIMDFGKFKYEESRQKTSISHKTKELFITAHIGEHDIQTKVCKLKEFIEKKYSIIFGIKFKNRKQRADPNKFKPVLIDCLNRAEVKTENLEFNYSPDKITVFIR